MQNSPPRYSANEGDQFVKSLSVSLLNVLPIIGLTICAKQVRMACHNMLTASLSLQIFLV